MLAALVLAALLGAEGDPGLMEAPVEGEPAAAPTLDATSAAEAPASSPPPDQRFRPRHGDRTLRELNIEPEKASNEVDASKSPAVEIDPLRLGPPAIHERSLWAASILGFGVGLGSGFLYAGDPVQGFTFAAVDAGLWAALTGTVVAFNQLVIRNDFRTLKSLARGERGFGERENALYIASWSLAAALIASHLYQGIAGIFTARATNTALRDLAVVPMGTGAAVLMQW